MKTISQSEWKSYVERLKRIDDKAVEEFQEYVVKNLGYAHIPRQKLIDKAYAIATKYGEGSAALSAQAYDSIAAAQGISVPPALPAETASYEKVAKTVNGVIKNTESEETLIQSISTLVKSAGQKTTIENARRDNAEIAYITQGDTCPYCIALASKGWEKASLADLDRDGTPSHIHANCDCTYGVRFSGDLKYAGYNPEEYKKMYDHPWLLRDDEKPTAKNRLNALRREMYAKNKDTINEQKRIAYARRKEREESTT